MSLKDKISGKKDTRYIFFSGKGGVGKTSCAAATALYYANYGKRILLEEWSLVRFFNFYLFFFPNFNLAKNSVKARLNKNVT